MGALGGGISSSREQQDLKEFICTRDVILCISNFNKSASVPMNLTSTQTQQLHTRTQFCGGFVTQPKVTFLK